MSRFPPLADVPSDLGYKNRAETFDESDVTLTTDGSTVVSQGSVVLGNNGSVDRPTDNDSFSTSGVTGVEIEVKTPLGHLSGDLSANTSGATTAYLSGEGLSLSTSISNGSFTFSSAIPPGTYVVEVDAGGDSYTAGRNTNTSYPVSGTNIDITNNNAGNGTAPRSVNNISATAQASGEVTIGWPQPDDVWAWDMVKFQRTPDGETVQVDIQESADGGATWTTVATDIQRGQNIPADPENRCRIRVLIERASTNNHPALHAAHRRWIV